MTEPAPDNWEDVPAQAPVNPVDPERTGPFAVTRPVDGYAFTPDLTDPELRYQPQPKGAVPVPPRREPPTRIGDQVRPSGVWRPGGSARRSPAQVRMPRPHRLRGLLFGMIPLGLLGGGIYLVVRLYGF